MSKIKSFRWNIAENFTERTKGWWGAERHDTQIFQWYSKTSFFWPAVGSLFVLWKPHWAIPVSEGQELVLGWFSSRSLKEANSSSAALLGFAVEVASFPYKIYVLPSDTHWWLLAEVPASTLPRWEKSTWICYLQWSDVINMSWDPALREILNILSWFEYKFKGSHR